jgi:hypothetical protein
MKVLLFYLHILTKMAFELSENPEEKNCCMVKRTSIAAWPNFYQAWTAIIHKI